MSAYKKLNKQDSYITTYIARKSWAISGSDYSANKINRLSGISGSSEYYPVESDREEISYKRLIYSSINQLYYSAFSQGAGLPSGSFDNYLQSSFISGSRKIGSYIGVYSIPRDIIGTHIEPGTIEIIPESGLSTNYVSSSYASENSVDDYVEDFFHIYGSTNPADTDYYIDEEGSYVLETPAAGGEYIDTTYEYSSTIVDDGEGNLYFKSSSPKIYVGNVIYTHGQLIITNEIAADYLTNYIYGTIKWKSNQPIYTHNYHCKVRHTEFNNTYNPTAVQSIVSEEFDNEGTLLTLTKKATGVVEDNITGSEFQPYITTVGLYNDANELIAVGKLGQPVPKSTHTDMTFIVKIDI